MPKQPKDLKQERTASIKTAFLLLTLLLCMAPDDEQKTETLNRMTETLYERLFPTVEKRKYTKKKREDKITIEEIKE